MDRSDFLRGLHDSCRELRDFLHDGTRRWLVNLIATGHDPDLRGGQGADLDIDRIYEILCYFTMVRDMADRTPPIAHHGEGDDEYRLPYSPGLKQNFTFFRCLLDGETFDLCCGTALPVAGEPSEHPDISLQRVESLESDGSPGEPIAIWDAKHHKNGPLGKGDVAQMHMWTSIFDLMDYEPGDVLTRLFSPQFQVSAILTNAGDKPAHRAPLLTNGFSVVLNFNGRGTGDPPDPSRADHLAHHQPAVS